MKKIALSTAVLLSLNLFCFLALSEVYAQKTVKMGGILTTSGAAAHLGQTTLNGVLSAVEELNAKGGITVAGQKYQIQFLNYDDKCIAKDAVTAAERLIRQDQVPVILGATCSHCCLAAMEVTEKEKIPIVTALAASMKITGMGYKYVFRTGPQSAIQTEAITRFAVQDLKLKNAAFIGRNDAWARSSAEEFTKRLEARGGKVLLTDFYELGTTDFYPQLTKAKAANPEFIYFVSLTEDGALAVKQARELGIQAQLMGTDEMANEQYFRIAGDACEGSLLYYGGGPAKPRAIEYIKKYEKKYGLASSGIDRAGYDTLMVIASALERAGTVTDGTKIRDAIMKTDLDGVRSRYTFAENGQAKCEMWIVKVENKKIKFIKAIPVYENPAAPM